MRTQRFSEIPLCSAETFEEPPDPSLPGTEILGKYTVVRKLGHGGMGMVVAARHNELGGLFAIKFLLPGTESDQQTVGRFLREAKASSRLRGEHIVRVHDVGRLENGAPYMVMEYLEGQNLKSILRNGALALHDAVTYLLQICDAIAEAHDTGIVHRDLKPANLYLTKRPNGTPCIKVLDFGISKLLGDDGTDLTGNHIIGSLRYMSPEQIKASKSVDARTDIWAIGLIACEFFAAKLPFGGQTQFDIVTNILEAEPEPPSTWRTDLPPPIEATILRCLRKNPNARFQSVRELSEALRIAAGIPSKSALLVSGELSSISGGSTAITVTPDEPTKLDLTVTDNSPTVLWKPSPVRRMVITAVVTTAVGIAGVVGWDRWQGTVASNGGEYGAVQSELNGPAVASVVPPAATSGDGGAAQVETKATEVGPTALDSATIPLSKPVNTGAPKATSSSEPVAAPSPATPPQRSEKPSRDDAVVTGGTQQKPPQGSEASNNKSAEQKITKPYGE